MHSKESQPYKSAPAANQPKVPAATQPQTPFPLSANNKALPRQHSDRPRGRGRRRLLTLAALVAVIGYFGVLHRYDYVLESPGPTLNVLGDLEGKQIIETNPSYDRVNAEGKPDLKMVTVSISGGPTDRGISGVQILAGLFGDRYSIQPYSKMFPPQVTGEDERKLQRQFMENSQDSARAVAMSELGIPFKAQIVIADVPQKSPAAGKLATGDLIQSLETSGKKVQINSTAELYRTLSEVAPGSDLTVTVLRGGKEVSRSFQTVPAGEGKQGSRIGVYITTKYEFSKDIKINVPENIGGPSAGLAFTLGIIERAEEESILPAQRIAATGTIAPDGTVGPIGGVVQKIYGAKRDGATIFLTPLKNCQDLAGKKLPSGITVTPVENIKEALATLQQLKTGTDPKQIRACPQ